MAIKLKKVYLDTSVPNFIFADDAPEKQAVTKKFFKLVKQGKITAVVSTLVDEEISRASIEKQKQINRVMKNLNRLKLTDKAQILAEEYLKQGIASQKFTDDAYHLAIVTISKISILVSWNFKHLVNPKTKELVNQVNKRKGYQNIQIVTPEELINLYE